MKNALIAFTILLLSTIGNNASPIELIEKQHGIQNENTADQQAVVTLKFKASPKNGPNATISLRSAAQLKKLSNTDPDDPIYSNQAQSIFGFNFRPVTKRNEIYLIVENSLGDTLLLNNINGRIAQEIPKSDGFNQTELFLYKIDDQIITVLFRPYGTKREGATYKLRVLTTGGLQFVSKKDGLPGYQ